MEFNSKSLIESLFSSIIDQRYQSIYDHFSLTIKSLSIFFLGWFIRITIELIELNDDGITDMNSNEVIKSSVCVVANCCVGHFCWHPSPMDSFGFFDIYWGFSSRVGDSSFELFNVRYERSPSVLFLWTSWVFRFLRCWGLWNQLEGFFIALRIETWISWRFEKKISLKREGLLTIRVVF